MKQQPTIWKQIILRGWIILISIILGWVIYSQIIQTKVLESLGFLNTSKALQLRYKQYENSVLVHVIPSGYWVWYDGKNILLYGSPQGDVCENGYDPVFLYDTSQQKFTGRACALSLDSVIEFYNKFPYKYIFEPNPPSNFDIYDLINYLSEKQIVII